MGGGGGGGGELCSLRLRGGKHPFFGVFRGFRHVRAQTGKPHFWVLPDLACFGMSNRISPTGGQSVRPGRPTRQTWTAGRQVLANLGQV